MSKFTESMAKYFQKPDKNSGRITMIEVGLGPSGELRYPAYRLNSTPIEGVGAFQVSGIILRKSSATCNQALFQRNHMERDSYAPEDLCSVLIVGTFCQCVYNWNTKMLQQLPSFHYYLCFALDLWEGYKWLYPMALCCLQHLGQCHESFVGRIYVQQRVHFPGQLSMHLTYLAVKFQ